MSEERQTAHSTRTGEACPSPSVSIGKTEPLENPDHQDDTERPGHGAATERASASSDRGGHLRTSLDSIEDGDWTHYAGPAITRKIDHASPATTSSASWAKAKWGSSSRRIRCGLNGRRYQDDSRRGRCSAIRILPGLKPRRGRSRRSSTRTSCGFRNRRARRHALLLAEYLPGRQPGPQDRRPAPPSRARPPVSSRPSPGRWRWPTSAGSCTAT